MTDEEIKKWGNMLQVYPEGKPPKDYVKLVNDSLKNLLEEINNTHYDLIILDEINVAMYYDLITKETLEFVLNQIPSDIEIVCTQQELYKGAIALVQLPSRILCPLCNGQHRDCYLCNGLGRIASPSTFEIELPGDLTKTTIITVDLSNYRPDTFTNLTVKFLRIKITIISP